MSALAISILFPVAAAATPAVWASRNGGYTQKSDGWLWRWGDGDAYTYPPPSRFVPIPAWTKLSTGYAGAIAIHSAGTLWGWGEGGGGLFGDGALSGYAVPTPISQVAAWSEISASSLHAIAVRQDGTMWGTGGNYVGQVGNGSTEDVHTFTQIGASRQWTDVSVRETWSYALAQDNSLWAWGLGIGTTPTMIDPGGHWVELIDGALARKDDGTMWGLEGSSISLAASGSDWRDISVGRQHFLGLKTDGTLWAWGDNSCAQLGTGDINSHWVPTQIGSRADWVAVSAGEHHSLAIDTAGMVWAWGANWNGQLAASAPEFARVPLPTFSTTDTVAPTSTEVSSTSHPDSSAWYHTALVDVSVTGQDDVAIRGYSLVIDPASPSAVDTVVDYTGPTRVWVGYGRRTIGVRAVDYGGNPGPVVTKAFQIDPSPPGVSFSPSATYVGSALVPVTAVDYGVSGVASITYQVDGGPELTVSGATANVAVVGIGVHSLTAWATDVAGNVGPHVTKSFTIAAPSKTAVRNGPQVVSSYGAAVRISGTVTSASTPVPGGRVTLYQSKNGRDFSASSQTTLTTTLGDFSLTASSPDRRWYRVVFASADPLIASSSSPAVCVTPKVRLSAPIAPSKMRVGRRATVYGFLRPKHTIGTRPVRIYKYRYTGGRWKSYGSIRAMDTTRMSSSGDTYTKYYASIRLGRSGKWRLRAYAPADSVHAATWSDRFDYVTVR